MSKAENMLMQESFRTNFIAAKTSEQEKLILYYVFMPLLYVVYRRYNAAK